jgi:hypothetical protein
MQITGKDINFALLIIVLGLFGMFIVWKQVSAETSYGLHEVIAIFAVIAGAFMNGYVGERRAAKAEKQQSVQQG